jgi:uncharacterized protein YjbJ (UPF0337 family)
MDTDKEEGTVQQVVGKVQETVGSLTGDVGTQVAGQARELGGKAQQLYADTASLVRDKTADSPFTTLAIVAAASFALGVLCSNGNSKAARRPDPRNHREYDRG